MARDVAERLAEKYFTDPESGCWVWQGAKCSHGYGMIWLNGQMRGAHRVSYEIHKENIADGLVIDHLCRNRACVNPNHLEPVTERENILRGAGITAGLAAKTRCKRGHSLDEENTYRRATGERQCRTCHREASRERRRKAVA